MPSFKEIKQELRAAYKKAGRALDEGHLPPAEVSAVMRDQAAAMCDLTRDAGMMDAAAFDAFQKEMEAFQAACDQGDQAAAQEAYDRLKSMKSDCHKRRK